MQTQRIDTSCATPKPHLKIWVDDQSSGEEGQPPPEPTVARANATGTEPSTLFTVEQVAALMAAMQPAGAMVQPPPVGQVQMSMYHLHQKTITEVIQPYFDWAAVNRAPKSVARIRTSWSQLLSWISAEKSSDAWQHLSVATVYSWVASRPAWKATTRSGRITDLKTVCAWLTHSRLISENPLLGIKKPTPQPRKTFVTIDTHRRLMAALKPGALRSLLTLAWETGARPQELRPLQARHVRLTERCLSIPKTEAKGRRRDRIIYLSPTATELVAELLRATPSGFLFRTKAERPFTASGLCHRMAALKNRLQLETLCLTEYRHGFAHRLLADDVPIVTVSETMGHVDTVMVSRVYGHHSQNRPNMLRAVGWTQ